MTTISNRAVTSLALVLIAGPALAGPIELQIGGSDLDIAGFGFGDYSYDDNSMGSPVLLDEGDDLVFNFGFVDVSSFALATGFAELTIQLLSPTTPSGDVSEIGWFAIGAAFDSGLASVDWGAPVSFGYSYGGASGGILSLNMFDIDGLYEDGFNLWGRITNVKSPTAVSEPGLLLLLGSGLLTAAALRRRNARRS